MDWKDIHYYIAQVDICNILAVEPLSFAKIAKIENVIDLCQLILQRHAEYSQHDASGIAVKDKSARGVVEKYFENYVSKVSKDIFVEIRAGIPLDPPQMEREKTSRFILANPHYFI